MNRHKWMKLMAVAVIACAATTFAAETTPAPVIKGNPNSKVYHKASCRFYKSKSSSKEFKTEADAKKAGYTPCKQCAASKKKKQESTASSGNSE